MNLKSLIAYIVLGSVLVACHPGHPHGCPPGQAKKGNCIGYHPGKGHPHR